MYVIENALVIWPNLELDNFLLLFLLLKTQKNA